MWICEYKHIVHDCKRFVEQIVGRTRAHRMSETSPAGLPVPTRVVRICMLGTECGGARGKTRGR